jgi:flagella basal body P-ring formation protein FlgA
MIRKATHPRSVCRLLLRAAALVLCAAAAGSVFAASLPSARFFERAEVEGDEIRLGDVARIDVDDPALADDLRRVVLGRSPLPGKSRVLDAAAILQRFKQAEIDPARLDLQFPAEIVVSRAAMEVGRDQIESAVKAFIEQQSAGRKVRLKELKVSETVVLPTGRLTTRVSAPRHMELAGSVPLAVELAVNGEAQKKIWVTATLEALALAVVTRRPMGRYTPLEEEDIETRAVDLAGLPSDFIADAQSVVGKRTRRALDANTVLRPDLVESPPLVKRGDRVLIVVEANGLRVTAVGQVKQTGCLGESIPVVNLDSNKIVHARVVDSRTVKIEF